MKVKEKERMPKMKENKKKSISFTIHKNNERGELTP
jgi:hypothetical protein